MLYGILCIVNAVWLATFSPTATVMFGALLNRVADPFTLMNVFHFLYTMAIVLSALRGIMGILAGFTLLARASSARMVAIVAAVFSLASIPLGTTLGIYTLILMLRSQAEALSSAAGERLPNLRRQTMPS
jgi:hypothetical protein